MVYESFDPTGFNSTTLAIEAVIISE